MTLVDPVDAKACCVTSYSSDAVSLLLGDSYHPGGLALTRRLLDSVDCGEGTRLLDVASGLGTSAFVAAAELGAEVDGVDLASPNVAKARELAAERGVADRVRFHVGDAERLPLPDGGWDAVICECALCTFPDKPTAVAELARVLKPGGRLGITDITADEDRLPPALTDVLAWVACVAGARPRSGYVELLESAGLRVTHVEDHDAAIGRMIDRVEARLELLRITSRERLDELGLDLPRAGELIEACRAAVADGTIGYSLIVAEKPWG